MQSEMNINKIFMEVNVDTNLVLDCFEKNMRGQIALNLNEIVYHQIIEN